MTRRILIALALIGSAAPAAEPISDARVANLTKRLRQRLDDLAADRSFPGVSVGFVLPDGRSAGVAAGFADVEANTPLKPTDRLLAGSVGKTFVAAVTLQLVEEGKLGLDDKVDSWLGKEPWYARLPNGRDLTLRHLLSHRAGLPEYFEQPGVPAKLRSDPDATFTPADLIAFVLDAKPPFKAGEGYGYADTNYLLVGLIVEKATGKPLFDEITRRLLTPLKLDRTIPSDRLEINGLAVGYSMPRSPFGIEGRMIVNGKFLLNPGFEYAGGGLASTPEDLAKWAKALYEGKAFKKKETLDAMLAGLDTGGGRGGGRGVKYGLGVMIRDTDAGPTYGHGGWFPGFLTEVEYDPKTKVAVAIQFNTDAGRAIKKGVRAHLGDVTKLIREAVAP